MKLRLTLVVLVALAAGAACAPKRLVLPSGPGTPVADFRSPFEQASAACRGVHSVRTSIALSGHAETQRMRGTLIAGVEEPDAVRLEGVAPFGPPVFILAARRGTATLLLPRDNRVLRNVSAADILEALAGVRLDPAALRGILGGCVSPAPEPVAGRAYSTDGPVTVGVGTKGYPPRAWLAIDVGPGTTAYLRQQQGQWRIVAGVLPELQVEYGQFENGLPHEMQIHSRTGTSVDLALALSDVAINVALNPAAFTIDVPADAVPITLAELREAGPLGAKKAQGSRSPEP